MNPNFISRNSCPCCQSSLVEQIYSKSYESNELVHYLKEFYLPQGTIDFSLLKDVDYVLMNCITCELVYQKNVPNDELLKILYDQWIDPDLALKRDNDLGLDYRLYRLNEIVKIIDFFSIDSNKLEVLDFGMGWGSLCCQFKSLGVNAKGSELSIPRIENAKKNGIEVLTWEEIGKSKFHFINTDDVFEHLTEPRGVLKYLVDSLHSKGVIKISVPNGLVAKKTIEKMDWWAPRGTQYNLNAVSPLEHLNCFTPKSLIELTKHCGLKYIQIKEKRSIKDEKHLLINQLKDTYRRTVLGIKYTNMYFQLP